MSYPKKRKSSTAIFNAKVTTTVSIAMVLFLLGLTVLTFLAGQGIAAYVKEQLTLSVALSENISSQEIKSLQKKLQSKHYIKAVKYISKEEVKQQLIEDLGRDPEEILGYNPTTDCLEISLQSQYASPDSIDQVERDLARMSVVQNVLYDADDLHLVNANLSKIGLALLSFALLLTIISVALIQNTIRLNIYAKRFFIHTMRLVGATNGFVRRPFVVGMVWSGVIAGILANIALWGVFEYLLREYSSLVVYILSFEDMLIVWATVILLGILLSCVASIMAVNRYLRMNVDKYFYV